MPLHLVSLAAASEPRGIRSQPSTQYLSLWPCRIIHREAFSYCYALGYFLVCSQRLPPAIFVSLYCEETHSQVPLTNGFWPSWSVGSTGGRRCMWEKVDSRVFLSVCATAGASSLSLQPMVGASSHYYCSSEFLTLSSSVSRLCKHNPYFRFSLFEIPRDVFLFLTDNYVLCLTNFH